jgi:hypothetical protein
MQKLAKPAIFQSGYLKPLPEDYVGERHVVIVSREPSPNGERCRFEERPGPGPPDLDDSALTVYLTE